MEGRNTMSKYRKILIVAALTMYVPGLQAELAADFNLEFIVATDKPAYGLGEDLIVYVSALNLDSSPVQLGFPSMLQASYQLDGVFDWTEGKGFFDIPSSVTIGANETFTWNLTYGSDERSLYQLEVGVHSIVGEVVGYGYSTPVEFQVIPEPSIMLILGTGALVLRQRRRC
jgi:hypothetical protein